MATPRKPSKRDIEYAEAQLRRLYHLGRLPPAVAREVAAGIAQDNAKGQPMTEYECSRGCRSAVLHELHPSIELRCNAHNLRMFPKETAEVHRAISRINSGDDKRLGSAQYTGKR